MWHRDALERSEAEQAYSNIKMNRKYLLAIPIIIALFAIFMFLALTGRSPICYSKITSLPNNCFDNFGEIKISNYTIILNGHNNLRALSNGYEVDDFSRARAEIIDLDVNKKIKVKIRANISGKLEEGKFNEFSVYIADSSSNRYGIALMGTRDRVVLPNVRSEYFFTEFSIENTENEIIFNDNTGREIRLDENSPTTHKLSDLNQNDKWYLIIQNHLHGTGESKLEIFSIEID